MARIRPDGGVHGSVITSNTTSAVGMWSLKDLERSVRNTAWPSPPPAVVTDANFYYNTFLTHAEGTDGSNNTVFVDGSTNSLIINTNGKPQQGSFSPFSHTGWSNYFNGSSDYLQATVTAPDADFTIEGWVNFSTVSSGVGNSPSPFAILGASSSAGFQVYGSALGWAVRNNSQNILGVGGSSGLGTPPVVGRWYHVAFVRNSGTVTLYVDGSSVGSSSTSYTFTDTSLTIGRSIVAGTSYFNGYVSNLRYVSNQALYTSNFTPSTTPLTKVGGTDFLSCQSNRFVDNSSNARSITITSTASVQPFSPFVPSSSYSTSTVGGSAYLAGSSSADYLQSSGFSAALLPSTGQDFTIEFWAYPLATARQDWFNLQATSGFNRILFYYSGTQIVYSGGDSTAASARITYTTSLFRQWYHIALCRSSGSTKMFVNGTQVGSTYTDSLNWTNNLQFTTGKDPGGSTYVTGYMSNIRYVKGTALYTSNFTVPTAPLTAISNTALLLNFTNAGVIDQTGKNNIVNYGTATISTTQEKFGNSSISIPAATNSYYLSTSSEFYDLRAGSWTIELWVYPLGTSTRTGFISKSNSAGTSVPFLIEMTSSGFLQAIAQDGVSQKVITDASSLTANAWTHVALVRNVNTLTLYKNGVSVGTPQTLSGALVTTTDELRIGVTKFASSGAGCYIDDVRITKGVAVYTTGFTPPSTTFADQ